MPHHEAHPATTTLALSVSDIAVSHKPTEEELSVIANLPGGSALLIGIDGQFKGARFLLTADTDENGAVLPAIAGRSPESDIYLDDVTVSRRHALFIPNAGSFILTDADSLNGTYVNGDRVDQAYLKNGDEVHIGKFHFAFYLGSGH
ncbi:MAG: FHA domain-containing protein [Rothia sp. (in: high G+C Gram-positive bacteria)]|nr:FHA domain-containing protein [Rothia sp. (in: high G+C Gram-positive bacteria)]